MIMKLIVNILAVFLTAYLLPGVTIESYTGILLVTLLVGVLNTIVKPILVFLTFPITLFTLGLFSLVISGFLILVADYLIAEFSVDGFLWAVAFSIVLSIVNAGLNLFLD